MKPYALRTQQDHIFWLLHDKIPSQETDPELAFVREDQPTQTQPSLPLAAAGCFAFELKEKFSTLGSPVVCRWALQMPASTGLPLAPPACRNQIVCSFITGKTFAGAPARVSQSILATLSLTAFGTAL